MPAVLCPHGHWANGRFYEVNDPGVKELLAIGAERFEAAARNHMQARCVQLARMGCVVFQYDMIGYADSVQIPFEVAHKFRTQRPEMNGNSRWGLFSPQAESRFQSVMGLQTWNSIRAVDFLVSLPDVDPDRLAITGASGGGTQTFVLAALDDRIDLSIPAVMVSTAMQGGCTCENASGLRIGTGNVEIAAVFAPKPMGMTAADDWTKEMTTKGYPELQALYRLMGAKGNVALWSNTHFKHNYNHVNRTSMYGWVNTHFKLGMETPVLERDFHRLSRKEMSVWNEMHPAPSSGPEVELKLTKWLDEDHRKNLEALRKDRSHYLETLERGLDIVFGRNAQSAGKVEWEIHDKIRRDGHLEMNGFIRNLSHDETVPVSFLYPEDWNGTTILLVSRQGKAGAFVKAGDGYKLSPMARKLVEGGSTVVAMDLFMTGEFLADGKQIQTAPRVENPREFAGYTHGYNDSLGASRVHDILSVLALVRNHERPSKKVGLVAMDGLAHVAAGAIAQDGKVDWAVLDTKGFRFGEVPDIRSVDFVPGAACFDDLPGLLAKASGTALWLAGESNQTFAPFEGVRTTPISFSKESGKKQIEEVLSWIDAN